ncbi:acyl transferase/acyl hydrolase/lysophospholipase [Cadophora sp. MPI-SDFR-AT-0126]|nr:acyl transferase/acyl hydrolase/lysophospholipase [Leotiomycetes sp. MPI-SDFR-AT-0126]
MSSSNVDLSTQSVVNQPVATPDFATPNDRSEDSAQEPVYLPSSARESILQGYRTQLSVGDRGLSYRAHNENGGSGSSLQAIESAERLRTGKLAEYIKIWRKNFILTLDGGGVRGYSQLIILKALMDKVAVLERATFGSDGSRVDSSFHPIPLEEVRQKKRSVNGKAPRARTTDLSNGHANGLHVSTAPDSERDARTDSDSSSDDESFSQFYPYHYFDWIAGTSTGGLNAIMLGRLRMSVDECLKDYADLAKKVFGKPRWASYRFSPFFWFCAKYSGDRMSDVVKKVVDEHLCQGEGYAFAMNKDMCRTVVVAMKKNRNGHEIAHLFRSYEHHRRRQATLEDRDDRRPNPMEKPGPADSSLIWQVARATSAAPSYFSTIKIGEDEYGDGGFGANNPSTNIFWEVSQMNNNFDDANTLSLSIGTGISRFSRFRKGPFKRPLGWLNAAKKVSTDCEKAHVEMGNITHWGRKNMYHRFNVPEKATDPSKAKVPKWQHMKTTARRWFGHNGEPLDRGLSKIKLDEWKPRGIWRKESTQEEIERITREYLSDPAVDEELDKVAEAMVSHRRARATTTRWAAYALGVRYECPVVLERCPDETWTEESDLRRHLIEDHAYPTGTPQAERHMQQAIKAGKYFEHHH